METTAVKRGYFRKCGMAMVLTTIFLCCVVSAVGYNVFTDNDNGATVNIISDSVFYVKLPENPTTGYQWELSSSKGLDIIDSYYAGYDNQLDLEGVGGIHVWIIRATGCGNPTISGVYKQSGWSGWFTSPQQMYSLTIHIVPYGFVLNG